MSKNWLDSGWDQYAESNKRAYSSISVMGMCMSNYMQRKKLERSVAELERIRSSIYSEAPKRSGFYTWAKECSMSLSDGVRYLSLVTLWGAFVMLLRALAIMVTVFIWIPFLIYLFLA